MDTTKTSNPSSKADEADDLIEELARLMADDAQINTPSAQPVPKAGGFKPRGLSDESAVNTPDAPHAPPAQPTPTAPPTTGFGDKGGAPDFDLNQFDRGTPKAEISSVSADVPEPSVPSAHAPVAESKQKPSTPASGAGEFDFGFGVGPVGTSTSEAPQQPLDAPSAGKSTDQTSDPIADLINAAVSKHDNVGTPGGILPQTPPEGAPASEDATRDSFASPPVFGVEGTPAPAPTPETGEKPFGGSMALDEIESLIGNSVNVDTPLSQPDMNAQMAVEGPPLTPPSSANALPTEAKVAILEDELSGETDGSLSKPDSAEAAILQAMAAAGTASSAAVTTHAKAEIPAPQHASVEIPAETGEPMLAPGRVALPGKSKNSSYNYLLPLAGILVVGAIGLGGYLLLNPGQSETDAPVLLADGAATRQAPPPSEPAPESVVLNQIDGSTAPTTIESLVSRDETEGATGPVIRQVVTADNSEAGLANRRVRTVTVRPDGTIISGEDAVAGGQALPVAQPNLPDLPANAVNTELSGTTVAALPQNPAIGANSVFDGNSASATNPAFSTNG
ncbi:MAG: hypothetical protein L3J13_05335, partial [Devosiaceae bacterium]|nr:hypothetical protein [Devosiaceae bacterium]